MKTAAVIASLLAAALVNLGEVALAAQPAAVQEVVLTHPNWEFPAYFTIAADDLAAEMKTSLLGECSKLNLSDAEVWFCQEEGLFFYSGVDGWGEPSRSGYICEGPLGLKGQRYFGDSRFKDHECVFLWWDKDARRYALELPER